ncbi:hypothetical protein BU23DRAFT_496458 [Bimuria novae-zelandiae CBS 107.79]|uniref:Uncharacterized protein n=1 Tax=Bimuria novae-zelandiae CBS 107.79 TaxID=1447943 RepID=A0A6A5VSV5_9PLEO|nr:hypothetical protein BU23DRAFT_496458 [Bimuria novae-zelandiae CBS 107.79]
MAGFGLPASAHTVATSHSNRPLPTGPCSHRDVIGTCGCEQFWDSASADVYEGSPSSKRSTTCVCGHHACFHKPSAVVAVTRAASRCDGSCQAQLGTQCDVHKAGDARRDASLNSPTSRTMPTQPLVRNEASLANGSRVDNGRRDPPSQPSSSGLPRIPSVCLMSNDRYPAATRVARGDANQSRQTVTGLGLSMLNMGDATRSFDRPQSVVSTVPDDPDIGPSLDAIRVESNQPSNRPNSVRGEHGHARGAAPGPLDAILEFNQHHDLHLDVSGDTIPNTFNLEDFVQSATEVATPSIKNTPDLAVTDQVVQDGKRAIEDLMQITADLGSPHGGHSRSANATSATSPQLLLTNSPHLSQEHVHKFLNSTSPQSLQKLVSYLPALFNLLNSIPNVANTMKELNDRISLLESNNSFNYAHPEDVQEKYDYLDGRVLHLETRMDDHDTLHQTIDADNSSLAFGRRRLAATSGSFQSNRSLESTTSSALILAAVDRKETETQISGLKDRLDVLEAFAMPPTLTNPWVVEIVLLPWGRDLKGIWFAEDEPMHELSNPTTQDTEEWTQARSSLRGQSKVPLGIRELDSSPFPATRHSSRSSHPFSDTESGWSSQAISNWASGLTDELLSAKACKSTNLVYKRLKSRGLIKDVVFRSASARDIQMTLSHAFKDMFEHLKYTDDDDDEPLIRSHPGLRASFIPLRKVRHDSKLQFLAPAEMASSALWSAQFLASDILMHVTGGKKRLYVTQREAYIQSQDQMGSTWTWQELRELPRYQPEPDVQMEGNGEQCQPEVGEADAKEPCWAFFEAYDAPPPSVNSSFGSHHSMELSMRPAGRNWRRSITPMPILKNPIPQPISPLSEAHPRRPLQTRQRTVSASVLEPSTTSSKRRLNSSPVKHSSYPRTSREPSVATSRMKRRRVSRSISPRPIVDADEDASAVVAPAWNNTPRRSREPYSPFFSSVALPLPRTASDLASRPSQRSVAAVSKGTPFAYATPHSGPLIGGPTFGSGGGGGDTEPDEDIYQDDDDDGEQSWPGVTTGEEDSDMGDVDMGAEDEPASFSGDDSGFGSDSDSDDAGDDRFGAQHADLEDDDDEDDPLDALLGVLRD